MLPPESHARSRLWRAPTAGGLPTRPSRETGADPSELCQPTARHQLCRPITASLEGLKSLLILSEIDIL